MNIPDDIIGVIYSFLLPADVFICQFVNTDFKRTIPKPFAPYTNYMELTLQNTDYNSISAWEFLETLSYRFYFSSDFSDFFINSMCVQALEWIQNKYNVAKVLNDDIDTFIVDSKEKYDFVKKYFKNKKYRMPYALAIIFSEKANIDEINRIKNVRKSITSSKLVKFPSYVSRKDVIRYMRSDLSLIEDIHTKQVNDKDILFMYEHVSENMLNIHTVEWLNNRIKIFETICSYVPVTEFYERVSVFEDIYDAYSPDIALQIVKIIVSTKKNSNYYYHDNIPKIIYERDLIEDFKLIDSVRDQNRIDMERETRKLIMYTPVKITEFIKSKALAFVSFVFSAMIILIN